MHPMRHRRTELGKRRAEMAEAIGSTEEAIRLWEAGKRTPSEEWYPKIAKFLKMPVSSVIEMFSVAAGS